ncbi:MAG: hypothetical protein LBC85_00020 [Fibromonadaceae bacterium]|jgi:hypothetical protein|nr:hypothetical protein [Fibromonadaceae bacterium]
MKTAIIEKKAKIAAEPYSKVIDLGNGVMFPVESEEEAKFVEWMVEEAKAGRVTLPKRAPGTTIIPKNNDGIKREDWWPDYEYVRSDRF